MIKKQRKGGINTPKKLEQTDQNLQDNQHRFDQRGATQQGNQQ